MERTRSRLTHLRARCFHCHPGHANCKPSSVYAPILILRHRLRERMAGAIVSYFHLIHEGFHSQVKVVSRYAQVLLQPRRREDLLLLRSIYPSSVSFLHVFFPHYTTWPFVKYSSILSDMANGEKTDNVGTHFFRGRKKFSIPILADVKSFPRGAIPKG